MENMTIFLYFYTYASLGWVCESIYKSIGQKQWINSGFLHLPICPIYGFGALIIIYVLTPLTNYPAFVFIFAFISTSILEYITSWLMEKLFHTRWWDYSTYPFNIHGRVCLKNSTMFGLLGLFVMYFIHPAIKHFLIDLNVNLKVIVSSILFIAIIVDTFITVRDILDFEKIHRELDLAVNETREEIEKLLKKQGMELEKLIKKVEKHRQIQRKHFPSLQHHYPLHEHILNSIKKERDKE